MEKFKSILSKYAFFILIAGLIIIFISTSRINNLPSPFMLYPGEAIREYYTPLRIFRFIRFIGVIISLAGAFFFANNIMKLSKSEETDTDSVTRAIADQIKKNKD